MSEATLPEKSLGFEHKSWEGAPRNASTEELGTERGACDDDRRGQRAGREPRDSGAPAPRGGGRLPKPGVTNTAKLGRKTEKGNK